MGVDGSSAPHAARPSRDTDMPSSSGGSIAFRGLSWMLTGSSGVAIVAFALSAVLARVLPSADLGVAVLLLSVVGILQAFSEVGLSVAVVQRKQLSVLTRDNAFYTAFFVSLLVTVVLVSLAGPTAKAFGQPGMVPIFPWIGVLVVLRALFAVYRGLMLRSLDYRSIATIEIIGQVTYASIAIVLAVLGFGPGLVVWAQLAGSSLLLLLGWAKVRALPTSPLVLNECRSLLGFGFWVAANQILNRASSHVDRLIVATVLSPAVLGGYYLAQQVTKTVPSLVMGSINQTTLPLYARRQDDPRELERAYWRSLRYAMIVTFPFIVIIATHAERVILIAFGPQWQFAARLAEIISISAMLLVMGGGIFSAVLYACGKTRTVLFMTLFRLLVLPACILAGSRYGAEGVAWGLVAFGVIGRTFNQIVLSVSLGFSGPRFLAETWRPTLIALATFALGRILPADLGLVAFALVVMVQLTAYALLVRLVFKAEFQFLWLQAARILSAPSRRRAPVEDNLR
jgi:O-antigen/teichoic acid export membrane protein